MSHLSLREQQHILSRILRGHYNYFGITGNTDRIRAFLHETERIWGRALARRNGQRFVWEKFLPRLQRFPLPCAWTVHSTIPSEPTA